MRKSYYTIKNQIKEKQIFENNKYIKGEIFNQNNDNLNPFKKISFRFVFQSWHQ